MKKASIKIIILVIIGLLPNMILNAQFGPTPPAPPPEEYPPVDTSGVPVDGGIGLVLAAGVAFYSRKKMKASASSNNIIKI